MQLSFTKMTGAGNDFVMLDNRSGKLSLSREQIEALCCRRFGIGSDGLILVEPGSDGADYRMRYYNADGGEAEMCGNGARCFGMYLRHLGAVNGHRDTVLFDTLAGRIEGRYIRGTSGDEIAIQLTAPQNLRLREKIETKAGGLLEVSSVNTGVPHAVLFVPDVEKVDVRGIGAELRYHPHFAPKGTNVNFAQVTGPDSIRVRTYERGVEDETLACGTGVAASAILAHLTQGVAQPVKVRVEGRSILTVSFQGQGEAISNVVLQGPATVVFNGEIACPSL
jgi:diaminopimelate epimerase